ncbi:MAG: YbaB/EbfC family nucleoid-associated protein [Rickettsiales bacterium]
MNIQKMMKQAQEMQKKITDLQEEMEKREVEGVSGGGMVKATLNGKGTALKLVVDKSVIDPEDKEVMEDLIIAAFNDARRKADDMMATEMGNATAGMGLPSNFKLPF